MQCSSRKRCSNGTRCLINAAVTGKVESAPISMSGKACQLPLGAVLANWNRSLGPILDQRSSFFCFFGRSWVRRLDEGIGRGVGIGE
jgi:hypothetical protein